MIGKSLYLHKKSKGVRLGFCSGRLSGMKKIKILYLTDFIFTQL